MGYLEMINKDENGQWYAKWFKDDGEAVVEPAWMCDLCNKRRPQSKLITTWNYDDAFSRCEEVCQ